MMNYYYKQVYFIISCPHLGNDLKMVMLSDFLKLLGNTFQFSAPL